MAHELHFVNGRAQMAYISEEGLPWHGLGNPLKGDESLDEWVIAAGLDWEAQRAPLFTYNTDGEMIQLDRDVLMHSKTNQNLGFVTDVYKVVQPIDIMRAFEEIAGSAGYKLKTAGNLRDGKRIWALADCGDEFSVDGKGHDRIRRNILLSTSYDGSMATIVEPTTVRVVCQNTLAMAAGYSGENAKVRISHHAEFDPQEIRHELLAAEAETDASWQRFKESAMTLADRKVTHQEATEYFLKLFGNADANGKIDVERQGIQRNMNQIIEIYQNGQGQETLSAQGTAWGLVNAVTRWADHERNSRTQESRLNSAFFGNGAEFKEAAMKEALELAA